MTVYLVVCEVPGEGHVDEVDGFTRGKMNIRQPRQYLDHRIEKLLTVTSAKLEYACIGNHPHGTSHCMQPQSTQDNRYQPW